MATQAILLVEGHPTTRAGMAQVLRDQGFVTLDAEEAVQLVSAACLGEAGMGVVGGGL